MSVDKQKCGYRPDSSYVELAVEVFGMLADATRVRIILALQDAQELSVNSIAEAVDKSPAGVSQHLAKLRDDGLVATRKDRQMVFYRIADPRAAKILKVLKDVYCP